MDGLTAAMICRQSFESRWASDY